MEIAGEGIGGLRPPPVLNPPPVKLRPVVVDNVSSTWDLLKSFGPQEGPGGDEDSPVRPLNKEVWSDGDDEKVSERSTSQSREDWHSCLSTSVKDEYDDEDDVRWITQWEKGQFLGSGSFGSVYEAISDEGFFFAVKEVSLLDQGSQGKQSLLQLELEISLLSQFKHENIVRYLGTDKDDEKLYIFLELMTKGSLASLYQVYHLKDSQVSSYTRQILNGLKYLHDRHVLHRDIKCANILVDASGSLKLADFGLAKAIKINDAKSLKGSAFWMAPEVVNLKYTSYGLAADIWSLGCTVLEMLTGQPPYSPLEAVCY
ncbi:hypothetical protein ACJRO7_026736 [Eucalyptus globulus]|uniref:mitogen-activated protein kinase kinase kinase n=1 Tax=Eucalyptus globulus TaxID=34317 RepID=A0ABD3JV61_EUCGL